MMTLVSGQTGVQSLYGLKQVLRVRRVAGPDAPAGTQLYDGLQFNTGRLPAQVQVLTTDGTQTATLAENATVRIYFGKLGNTQLPIVNSQGQKFYLLEVAPNGGGEFWWFYKDSPAAAETLSSSAYAADTDARQKRIFYTLLKPGELLPYDPSQVVDSYTGPFGPDSDPDARGLEAAVGNGKSKDATGSGLATKGDGAGGAGSGTSADGGSGTGAGGGTGSGHSNGGIDIGIPGLGLGPDWKLPNIGQGLLILLLVVGGGYLLVNKAIK